jgi:predicted N-acetyltransferase YhbS
VHDAGAVLGYYAMATHAVRREDAPNRVGRALRPLDYVPALLLARLARDLRTKGTGLGPALLKHAFETSKRVASMVGVRVLVVDAKDPAAEAFYAKYGLHPLDASSTDYPRPLYLRVAQIP